MTSQDREQAERVILAAVEGSRCPVSFTTLRGAVYRSVGPASDGEMMSILGRLVARRLIVRRPVDPTGTGRLARFDVQVMEWHPAGRDAFAGPPGSRSDANRCSAMPGARSAA